MPYYPSGGAAGLPLGLAGATGATRYVGGTATGAPGSGTFSLGDYVIDQTGKVWVCTVAGTPGTWVGVGIAAAGGTPAVVLSTAAAAGVATTFLRDDDTIIAFDVTVPVTQAFSDAAATGSAAVAARRDHKHGMPANPGGVSWPLTNSGDETFQPNSVANSVLTLHNNATAVNLVTLTGTATGTDPTLVVSGDANRGLVINPAGTGTVTVGGKSDTGIPLTVVGNSATQTGDLLDIYQNSGGNALFKFATVSSGANGLTFIGSAASAAVKIAVAGTGTNVGLTLAAKGTGNLSFTTQTATVGLTSSGFNVTIGANSLIVNDTLGNTVLQTFKVTNGGNFVTFTNSIATAAPIVGVASGLGDTNLDLTISALGTGVINYGYASTAISGSIGAATLATTTGGATGPATSTQNAWLKVKINGTVTYLPTWV